MFSERFKANMMLKIFGFVKIPMLYWLGISIVELTQKQAIVKVPLSRRSKNHLNSMYFASLAAGADIAAGFLAFKLMHEKKKKFNFVFKDFKADFLKRAEGDTLFTCTQGELVSEMMNEAERTGERVNQKVQVVATVPSKLGDEPVALFELTMSVKLAH